MRALTCRELVDFLAEYLDGTLALARRALFEAHLARCSECVAYLRSYAETVRLARSVCTDPGAPLPPDVPEDLVRAILRARGSVA
jgi:predicted anti-sigma-YlaC factor YlaD